MNYINLPEWVVKNPIFKCLFVIRKTFFIRSSKTHFSQFGEDITINNYFEKRKKGVYVDVGCFHPRKHSNTWGLYKKGWSGINVDIDAIKIGVFNLVRRRDTNIESAVSDKAGILNYYTNGTYSLVNSVNPSYKNKDGYIEKTVKSSTLTQIIEESPYKGKEIDFLSVDAEEHDLEVMKSLDFELYTPKLVAVECYAKNLGEVEETELYQFMLREGYLLVGWCGLTLMMAHKSEFPAN